MPDVKWSKRRAAHLVARQQLAVSPAHPLWPSYLAVADDLVDSAPSAVRPYLAQVYVTDRGHEVNAWADALTADARAIFLPHAFADFVRTLALATDLAHPVISREFNARFADDVQRPIHDSLRVFAEAADSIASDLQPPVALERVLGDLRRFLSAGPTNLWSGAAFGSRPVIAAVPWVGNRSTANGLDAVRFVLGHEFGHHALNHFHGKPSRPPFAAPGPEILAQWRGSRARADAPLLPPPLQREIDADDFGILLAEHTANAYLYSVHPAERYLNVARGAMIGTLAFSLLESEQSLWARTKSHPSFAMRAENVVHSIVERFDTWSRGQLPTHGGVHLRRGHPALGVAQVWITTRTIARMLTLDLRR